MKTEYQKKKEAKARAARALDETKERLGIGRTLPLRGAKPSPLATETWKRKANPAPTLCMLISGSVEPKRLKRPSRSLRGRRPASLPPTTRELCNTYRRGKTADSCSWWLRPSSRSAGQRDNRHVAGLELHRDILQVGKLPAAPRQELTDEG